MPRKSWAFFFLYGVRRVAPLALVLYLAWRYDAWTDPVVAPTLLVWVAAILSFRVAVRHSLKPKSGRVTAEEPESHRVAEAA